MVSTATNLDATDATGAMSDKITFHFINATAELCESRFESRSALLNGEYTSFMQKQESTIAWLIYLFICQHFKNNNVSVYLEHLFYRRNSFSLRFIQKFGRCASNIF